MSGVGRVHELIRQAHNELAEERARMLLREAADFCETIENAEPEAAILKARVFSELALEESNPNKRAAQWRKSIQSIRKLSESKSPYTPDAAETFAVLAVDCFQDRFNNFGSEERFRLLRDSLRSLDKVLAVKDANFSLLLTRKASVLRHLSMVEISPNARLNRLQEANRCVDLARRQKETSTILLEQGNCRWALARMAGSDRDAIAHLRAAEDAFSGDIVQQTEAGRLALARFYRLTYRPLDACSHFPKSLDTIESLRHVLRDSYLYAEAATQLWFNDYPEQTYKPHLLEARHLLETATSAGYRNARLLVDLAFLIAILDGPPAGSLVLHGIRAGSGVSWIEASKIAAQVESVDLITQGFALGMDQGAVWTRLGTFARKFLEDDDLAEILYRTATRLAPHDAIALTNLARHLIRKGNPDALLEAERALNRASNFADRRFSWWRQVLTLLKEKKGLPTRAFVAPIAKSKEDDSLDGIRQAFQKLEHAENPQQRGRDLEKLVFDLCKITLGLAAPAYTIARDPGGVIRQIDGYFSAPPDRYRLECKWLSEPVGQNEIVIFRNKLDVAGISGLFISMAGFKDTAIAQAKKFMEQHAILLMDGEEARAVFNGYLLFDELLKRKREHFDRLSNPYHRVFSRAEVA